jgi:hypothetical protein
MRLNRKIRKRSKQKSKFLGLSLGKKGLGIAQAFVFIVAAITFVFIMIFGTKMVLGIIGKGDKVQFAQFETDLSSSVRKMYSQYGSVRTETFRLPGAYEQICFVDLDKNPATLDGELDALCSFDVLACDVWEGAWSSDDPDKQGYSAADQNVFLTPSPEGTAQMKIYQIQVGGEYTGFLCENLPKGKFSLRLEGKGDSTQISIPSR